MLEINIKKSTIYPALKYEFGFKLIKIFKYLILLFFLSVFSLVVYGYFTGDISESGLQSLSGLSAISFSFFIASLIKESFFKFKLKNPNRKVFLSQAGLKPENYNLAEVLSFETARAVYKSFKAKPSLKTSSIHLFYFLLKDNPKLSFIFSRILLDVEKIENDLAKELKLLSFSTAEPLVVGVEKIAPVVTCSSGFEETIIEALKTAQIKNHKTIEIEDILFGLAKHSLFFKKLLIDSGIKSEDIDNLAQWLENIEERKIKARRFWDYDNLMKGGTLAKEWTSGYTVNLDKYSKDLTDVFRKGNWGVIGHKEEIELAERILSRSETNNVLIVGQPGTGRKSIIQALAQRTILGQSSVELNYKRVVELDMNSLLAEIENPEQVESTLNLIFKEAVLAGDIILVIDEFHNYVGRQPGPGIVDISGVIASFLKLPQFSFVAISDYEGFHRYIEKDSSFVSLFEKVEVSEIKEREILMLLENSALSLERKHKIMISYPAIREIVSLTRRYMPSLAFPEKAIEVLDEVAVYVAKLPDKTKIVLPKHVAKIITEKTEIPVGEIETGEKEILLNLEELIHKRIINQEEAVKEISTAMRRARTDITVRKGPMGAFIFLGPTGVGKTETSKALAEVYFKSEKRMLRIDMSEFQNLKDIDRLIGSIEQEGILTTAVRENPFSLLLLDEIEKAHPNILNLFLQVLDEGYLTDGLGRKTSFENTIIIATSNAGYKLILQVLKELTEGGPFEVKEPFVSRQTWEVVKKRLLDYLFNEGIFRPEFINRFDAFVVFSPLSKKNLLGIAGLLLEKLKKNLKEKEIEFVVNQPLKEKIVELGYNPVFGAREMRRVIQDKVENVLADALLKGELKKGSKVEMDSEFKLKKI